MMMEDDALSMRFGPVIALHYSIANILHGVVIRNRRDAYDEIVLYVTVKLKLKRNRVLKLHFL